MIRTIATLSVGLAIFLGLPLLGWGADDARGLLGEPARRAYAVVVVVLNSYAAIRMPEIGKRRGHATKTVDRQRWAVVLLQILTIAIVIAAPYSDHRDIAVLHVGAAVRWIGLGLYSLGFLVMHWAEVSLGKQFSLQVAIQEDHRLVTAGLYRYLRHPRYFGIIMFAAGIALVFRSGLALLLVAATGAVLLWRIQDEEALMRQEFGADWDAYSRRTWRLLPFIY